MRFQRDSCGGRLSSPTFHIQDASLLPFLLIPLLISRTIASIRESHSTRSGLRWKAVSRPVKRSPILTVIGIGFVYHIKCPVMFLGDPVTGSWSNFQTDRLWAFSGAPLPTIDCLLSQRLLSTLREIGENTKANRSSYCSNRWRGIVVPTTECRLRYSSTPIADCQEKGLIVFSPP